MRTIKFFSTTEGKTVSYESDSQTLADFLGEIGYNESNMDFFVKSSSIGRAKLLSETILPHEDCTIYAVTAKQKAGGSIKVNISEILARIEDDFNNAMENIKSDIQDGDYDGIGASVAVDDVDIELTVDDPTPQGTESMTPMTEDEENMAEARRLAGQ